jgi:hypothetical protein
MDSIEICNMALTMLATSRITTLEDANENARKLNIVYQPTKEALLSEHNWNFAIVQDTLSEASGYPVIGIYAYHFSLPYDCIRVIRVEDDEPFVVLNGKVLTNSETCVIEYISNADEGDFSPGFSRALAFRLAADLAFGVTQNATLAQGMELKAQQALKEAKWTDAQEGGGSAGVIRTNITDAGH